jgi:hypothetical protein
MTTVSNSVTNGTGSDFVRAGASRRPRSAHQCCGRGPTSLIQACTAVGVRHPIDEVPEGMEESLGPAGKEYGV